MQDISNAVAIIGMSGRFPGARNIAQFWENQRNGVEAISHFSEKDLEISLPDVARGSQYVKARPLLENAEMFDAAFFGIYPKEAELMDPQHRIFLQCCWEALEDAGYDPLQCPATGVFAGCSPPTYFLRNVCRDQSAIENYVSGYPVSNYNALLGSNPDFLATRVSYKLNLKGPAFTMMAGCSTSLLSVCQACQSLQTFQCDMALAGGISITFPQKRGYFYQEGGMVSPDGHCRAFDEQANGTVFGSGSGVVVLKRLEDAIASRDYIYALVLGYGMNNDGAAKVGYTAPSVEGQAAVIAMAQAAAGVGPESIGYVEAHGTGTPLGDPIEVAALTQAFRAGTQAKNFCVLGTAKTNVGHLDIASGITGLIHATQILRHAVFPPTLHFDRPNPKLNLAHSPFYVNTGLRAWIREQTPRRAGVSSFGVGGTNAHVVLQEAPVRNASSTNRQLQLLLLSAKSENALASASANLAGFLEQNKDADLADVAYTLQTGRSVFEHRRFIVAADTAQAADLLRAEQPRNGREDRERSGSAKENVPVVFMFPGQGSQYCQMGRQLYGSEPEFRQQVDTCAEILRPLLPHDLREVMYAGNTEAAQTLLNSTIFAQPAIFVTEFALAKLWMHWGIQPKAMIGHSVGEFVAACLGGVFSLEDGLRMVAARAKLMQALPEGSMLAVKLAEEEARSLCVDQIAIAAVNTPKLCVLSGPTKNIQELEQRLKVRGVVSRRLHTSHAFHSPMMDAAIEPFTKIVSGVRLAKTSIPYVSGTFGTWILEEQSRDPQYWATHLRQPVRFADGIKSLAMLKDAVLLEVGPGNTLCVLASQNPAKLPEQIVVPSLTDSSRLPQDVESLLIALGRLWMAGVPMDWANFHSKECLHRMPLPTYPFEEKRYWIDVKPAFTVAGCVEALPPTNLEMTLRTPIADPVLPVSVNRPEIQGAEGMNSNRVSKFRETLISIFQELSGVQASALHPDVNFMELGFDSLFLTQISQEIHNRFGVKVTFRQLLDQQSSINALADFMDTAVSKETTEFAAPQVGTIATPAVSDSTPAFVPNQAAGGTTLEAMMREQLRAMSELMSRQLEALRGTSHLASSIPAISPSASASISFVNASPLENSPAGTDTATPKNNKQEVKAFGPYKPPTPGQKGGITPAQERHISTLIARYTAKTAKSKRSTQQYRHVMADPRVVSGFRSQWKELVYPLVTDRSEGSRLYDIDGNEYIDILNGFGPTVFGHRPKFVVEAVRKQLELGFEIGPMSHLAGPVATLISELTGMERVAFCNTGSEAVLCAMRVARTVTGRNKIVMFAGDYHGMFDEVLVRSIKRPGAPLRSAPIAPGIPPQAAENMIVLDYGATESLDYIRAHADEIAAVMVEPAQSRHPNLQPREFLQELRKITEQSGVAYIFDEVVTGFRSHPGGAQAIFGVRADMTTYGKVVAGGLPIGILAGKPQFMDALDGGMWQYGDDSFPEVGVTFFAGTFVRHPLALAAAHSVLTYLKEQGPQLQERLNARTARMVERINTFLQQRHVPLHVENFASVFYFAFPQDIRFSSLFYYHMRDKGIHLQEGFPCFLTTEHSDADIERIIEAFQASIAEMQADELLPGSFMEKGVRAELTLARPTTLVSSVDAEKEENLAEVPAAGESALVREAPLSEAQMEIWLVAQLSDEASCAYNESLSLCLDGVLDQHQLHVSIQELIDRHDALRTTFTPTGHLQKVSPQVEVEIPFSDWSVLSAQEQENKLRSCKEHEAKTPFDLVSGPPVRFHLVRLSEQRHLLVLTAHHIVCDGWSMNVVLDELGALYSAKCGRADKQLPAPKSFRQYLNDLSQSADAPETTRSENYWLEQFAQAPADLDLPTDHPRLALRSYAGATFRTKISASATQQIKRAGAKHGCTLFVTLLSGFEAVLSRLSGQDDIVVGIPTAGQAALEGGPLVGHCVNFLPLRAHMDSAMKFSDLLTQQKRKVMDAYEHQAFTYGTLVRKLSLPRDSSRLPLMEVQFNLEKVGTSLQFAGMKVEVDPNPKAFVNFDLFLNIVESEDGLILDCDYNTGLYEEATIARWLRHYETLLLGFVADPEQTLQKLPVLNEAEMRQILVDWNNTAADYPRQRCVHELFELQVQRTPGSTAAMFEGQNLTYAQLDCKANQLANHLLKIGVGKNTIVGIFMDRSLDVIVALLGVLKAGAAYLPLDPIYPRERIEFILTEASAPVLLTQSQLAVTLPGTSARIICLDSDWDLIARESERRPASHPDPKDLAYLIYTSGSTGKPKGVEVPHQAVVNLLWSMAQTPGMDASDRMLAVTTLSFDIAALELFLPLAVGAQLVIASRETAADPVQLMATLTSSEATMMQATPVTWRMLLEAGWEGQPLKKALCGGEALPLDLAGKLTALGISLWNMYGPTETTIWSSTCQVPWGTKKITIGPPIANTQFYIVDALRQPVPIGVPGELCIGGDGVARGYFNRPELTTDRFVTNPFREGARLYRTGDSARYLQNGSIDFLGRLDHQVKLRGFRIELEEIETVVSQYPGVRQAVVVIREDIPGDQRLVCYIVRENGTAFESRKLRDFVKLKLPEYMTPSAFVPMQELPRTANGKIDRRALPKPDFEKTPQSDNFIAPSSPEEKILAEIWSEVLKIDRVGTQDNLLELGADSIHIFQITARAHESGLEITAKQLLQARTISALCAMIQQPGAGIPGKKRIARVARDSYRTTFETRKG